MLNLVVCGCLNGLFVGLFFCGGVLGVVFVGSVWVWGGWSVVCGVGFVFVGVMVVFGLVVGCGVGVVVLDWLCG